MLVTEGLTRPREDLGRVRVSRKCNGLDGATVLMLALRMSKAQARQVVAAMISHPPMAAHYNVGRVARVVDAAEGDLLAGVSSTLRVICAGGITACGAHPYQDREGRMEPMDRYEPLHPAGSLDGLDDEELNTVMDAIVFYRDSKLDERAELGLPLYLIRQGDTIPGPETLGGQIIRAVTLTVRDDQTWRIYQMPYSGERPTDTQILDWLDVQKAQLANRARTR